MRIGLIGVGVVGGVLKKYFEEKTNHELRLKDPAKGYDDSFDGVEAVFIAVPVPHDSRGQNLNILKEAVEFAKNYTQKIFIRSTVLPGTNDNFGTIAMPEFLTERRAYEDMCKLPIVVGQAHRNNNVEDIFPDHDIVYVSNKEAELAKFTHNLFGAVKVTYFNMIYKMAKKLNADFDMVKMVAGITGYVGKEHTMVPGPDGHFGYGGKCFPENMAAFTSHILRDSELDNEWRFLYQVVLLNNLYRFGDAIPTPEILNLDGMKDA